MKKNCIYPTVKIPNSQNDEMHIYTTLCELALYLFLQHFPSTYSEPGQCSLLGARRANSLLPAHRGLLTQHRLRRMAVTALYSVLFCHAQHTGQAQRGTCQGRRIREALGGGRGEPGVGEGDGDTRAES